MSKKTPETFLQTELYIPIYHESIYVVSGCDLKNANICMKELGGKSTTFKTHPHEAAFCRTAKGLYGLWFIDKHPQDYIMVHEAFHVMHCLCSDRGVIDEEAQAYLLQYIYTQLNLALNGVTDND